MFTTNQLLQQPGLTGLIKVPHSDLQIIVNNLKETLYLSEIVLSDAINRPAESQPAQPQTMYPQYQQMVPQVPMNVPNLLQQFQQQQGYIQPVVPAQTPSQFVNTGAITLPDLTVVKQYVMNILQSVVDNVNSALVSNNIPITTGVHDYNQIHGNILLELSPNLLLLWNYHTQRPNIHLNIDANKSVDPVNAPYLVDAFTNLVLFISFTYKTFFETQFHPALKLRMAKTDILVEIQQAGGGTIDLSVGHLILIRHKVLGLGNNMYKTLKIAGYDVKIDRQNFTILDRKTGTGPVFSNELLNVPIVNMISINDDMYKKYLSNPAALTMLSLVFIYNDTVERMAMQVNTAHTNSQRYKMNKAGLKFIDVYAKTEILNSEFFENIE